MRQLSSIGLFLTPVLLRLAALQQRPDSWTRPSLLGCPDSDWQPAVISIARDVIAATHWIG
jgi:hypothetical protein